MFEEHAGKIVCGIEEKIQHCPTDIVEGMWTFVPLAVIYSWINSNYTFHVVPLVV